MKKICMITTSRIDYDSRILNEAATLSGHFKIVILCRKFSIRQSSLKYPFQIKRIGFLKFRSFRWNYFSAFISLLRAAFRENPDIYHAHDLSGLLVSWPAAFFKRKILIYDSHELWTGLPPLSSTKGLRWLIVPLEKIAMLKVKKGITVNNSIAKILEKKYHREFLVLRNCPMLAQKKCSSSIEQNHKKIILYLGETAEWRGAEQIIQTASYLPENFQIIFLGANKRLPMLKKMIKTFQVEHKVIFLPKIPADQIKAATKNVTLALVLTQNAAQDDYYSLPNKIFQYIAAEIPILGSNFPEFCQIILGNQIGEVVDPAQPKLIAQKIKAMVKPTKQAFYRRHLKNLAQKKYNWTIESKKLINFYQELM